MITPMRKFSCSLALQPCPCPADIGVNVVDQNTHNVRKPLSHLAPIFAAVDAMPGAKTSKYDFKSLDIITDWNGLRKLLRWAIRLVEKDFRIDLDVGASGTVLFTRRDERTVEPIEGFRGFGQEYLKAAARLPPGLEKAAGHHRIIKLKMGGLKVLVRFTADACEDTTSADDLASIVASIDLTRMKTGHSATKSSTTPKPSAMNSPRTHLRRRRRHVRFQDVRGNVHSPRFAMEVLLGRVDPPSSTQPERILAKHERQMITELRRVNPSLSKPIEPQK